MTEVTRRRGSKAKRSDASYKLKNELKSLISRVLDFKLELGLVSIAVK